MAQDRREESRRVAHQVNTGSLNTTWILPGLPARGSPSDGPARIGDGSELEPWTPRGRGYNYSVTSPDRSSFTAALASPSCPLPPLSVSRPRSPLLPCPAAAPPARGQFLLHCLFFPAALSSYFMPCSFS